MPLSRIRVGTIRPLRNSIPGSPRFAPSPPDYAGTESLLPRRWVTAAGAFSGARRKADRRRRARMVRDVDRAWEGGRAVTLAELAMPLVATAVGAQFGRHINWPFPLSHAVWPHRAKTQHHLHNGVFWAVLTFLVVTSGTTIIEHAF